jgi:hypothetical protein
MFSGSRTSLPSHRPICLGKALSGTGSGMGVSTMRFKWDARPRYVMPADSESRTAKLHTNHVGVLSLVAYVEYSSSDSLARYLGLNVYIIRYSPEAILQRETRTTSLCLVSFPGGKLEGPPPSGDPGDLQYYNIATAVLSSQNSQELILF